MRGFGDSGMVGFWGFGRIKGFGAWGERVRKMNEIVACQGEIQHICDSSMNADHYLQERSTGY